MLYVYLKTTNECNLFCDHCYVPLEAKKQKNVLTSEVLESFVTGLKILPEEKFRFIWHGGEPFLHGVALVENYSRFIAEKLGENRCFFEVQTNLILDREELFKLVEFSKNFTGGVIGTSYDFGIRKLNGSHELFLKKWMESIRFLRENGIFISVVITLTRLVDVEKLFEFMETMMDICGIISFHLERFTPSGTGALNRSKLYLNNAEFFFLFEKILDNYVSLLERGRIFYLGPFEKMAREYFSGRGAGCFSGDCLSKILTLNPDGTVSSCPDLAFYDEYIFGNILHDSLASILGSPKRVKSICSQVQFVCPDCEYYPFCHGGCPHHYRGFDGVSCRRFFEKFVSVAEVIYSSLEKLRNAEKREPDVVK